MVVGRPLGPATCCAVAAEAMVEGWASSRGGNAIAESGARPRLAEGLLLRLGGRSDPDPVREDGSGDWAGDFWALRALLCLWVKSSQVEFIYIALFTT